MSTPVVLEPPTPEIGGGGGNPPPPHDPHDRGRGGGSGGERDPQRPDRGRGGPSVAITGMWVALAPILMLFLAFTSAYIVRHGVGADWTQIELPRLLWLNTIVLLASSLSLERGRASLRAGGSARVWVLLTLALGISFVVGQLMAWHDFSVRGIRINTTPYSSFFYLLTGAHGVHLAGGILGLVAAAFWPEQGWRRTSHRLVLQLAAIYWHFMGVLWLGLFALLNFWR